MAEAERGKLVLTLALILAFSPGEKGGVVDALSDLNGGGGFSTSGLFVRVSPHRFLENNPVIRNVP
ncbi:MAG TPA: hypothetical protein VG347_09545 [Verrucomicrobiae bacterium]|nr:hypothetical protein [Verrucomicrobiae bacterium]